MSLRVLSVLGTLLDYAEMKLYIAARGSACLSERNSSESKLPVALCCWTVEGDWPGLDQPAGATVSRLEENVRTKECIRLSESAQSVLCVSACVFVSNGCL